MGGGTFSHRAYASHSQTLASKSSQEILSSRKINPVFDPKNISLRESRNSNDHAVTTPVIIGLDVTGSMGHIAVELLRSGIGRAIKSILDTSVIQGPQIMFAAVGDSKCDISPLQVTQFESDNRMVDQLGMIWNECGGGGNGGESYFLPWVMADKRVNADAINEGRKGYIFTVGDEPVHQHFSTFEQKAVFGEVLYEKDVTAEEIYKSVCKNWYVFHLCVNPYSHHNAQSSFSFMGDHFIRMANSDYLPELIGAIISLNEGKSSIEEIINTKDKSLKNLFETAFQK
jgi:hypothetical protein